MYWNVTRYVLVLISDILFTVQIVEMDEVAHTMVGTRTEITVSPAATPTDERITDLKLSDKREEVATCDYPVEDEQSPDAIEESGMTDH